MASIYKRMPFFRAQTTWSKKTPLGNVYKLQSNSPANKQKAKIHNKTINDFIRGAEKVGMGYVDSFREFENVLLGRYLTDWKQVLHEHFPEPFNAMEVLQEHDHSLADNFMQAINLFMIKTLNESAPRIASISTWHPTETMCSIRNS